MLPHLHFRAKLHVPLFSICVYVLYMVEETASCPPKIIPFYFHHTNLWVGMWSSSQELHFHSSLVDILPSFHQKIVSRSDVCCLQVGILEVEIFFLISLMAGWNLNIALTQH